MSSDPAPMKDSDTTRPSVRTILRVIVDSISLPALLANIFWAGNPTAVSLALRSFSGLALTQVRLVGAILVLLALTILTRRGLRLPARGRLALLLLAGGVYGISVLCLTVGLRYTTAVNTSLLFSTSPLLAFLIGAFIGHERLSTRRILGAIVALVGVAIIVLRHGISFETGTLPGDILILTASLASAILATAQVFLFRQLGVLRTTTLVVGIGGILVLPITWAELLRQDWTASSLSSWGGVIYSIVFAVVVPMLLWNVALRAIGPGRTIIYNYLQPIFGAGIAVLVLSEPVGLSHVVGTALVLFGIGLSQQQTRWDAHGGRPGGTGRSDVVPETKVRYHSGVQGKRRRVEDQPCP